MIKTLDFLDPMDKGPNTSIDKLAVGSYIPLFLSIIYTQNSS